MQSHYQILLKSQIPIFEVSTVLIEQATLNKCIV